MSSGWTPSTDHVRGAYMDRMPDINASIAEFDRWLAEVKAEAWDRLCDWLDDHVDTDVRDSVKRAARDSNPYRTP